MLRREALFTAIAAGLVVLYAVVLSQLAPTIAPAAQPTPSPTKPSLPVEAPNVPGSIAFVLGGDVYVLREGRYAPLTSEGRNSEPHLAADGATIYFSRTDTIDGRRLSDGATVNARLSYSSIVSKSSAGGPEQLALDGLRQRRADGFHLVSWYMGAAASPDGKLLAVVESPGGSIADLKVLDLASGRLTGLSQGAILADPSWSPDGATIAVTTYNTDVAGILLWPYGRAGQAQRLDGLAEGEAYRPSFSPDGRWLTFTVRRDGRNDVQAYELETGRMVQLTVDGRSWNGVFSPDGRWLAFLREGDGTIDLYAMELASALEGGAPGQAQRLTHGEGIEGTSRPSWGR